MLNKLHNLVYKMELTMQILGASSFSIYNLQLPLDVIVRKEVSLMAFIKRKLVIMVMNHDQIKPVHTFVLV
ncbi:hypothetical protein Lalb_Chr01g0005701 [Lupinus albus]|uniref:Uncharacterized protein n=1 Tax=Lupinus albus TaxID=3870 RepID=A0A6A4R5V5_LUPAL|nr:hypothetical protein Lalb_Chr01g0005701 [Lupinus albus]